MSTEGRRGTAYGAGAYLLWGIFPLFFRALDRAGALEIVLHRVLWSLLVCLLIVTLGRDWAALRAGLRSGRRVGLLTVAAAVLGLNWGVYIYAVNSGQVVEAALGYYINPLVTVLLGVLVLRERLRPLQWAAVGAGVLAVAVLTVGYGRPPYIALTLALSFGTYGLIKNRVGGEVGAVVGLSIETLTLAPLAAGVLVWLELTGRGTFSENPPWQGLLLATTGVVTVTPLLLFASAARRVPLTTLGLLQYLTPTLQLLCGVLLLGETFSVNRWIGFGLVWLALLTLTADSLRAAHTSRRDAAPTLTPETAIS